MNLCKHGVMAWGRMLAPRLFAILLMALLLVPARVVHAASGSKYVFYEKFPPNNPRQWSVLALKDGSKTYLSAGVYHIVRAHPGIMRGWPLKVRMPREVQFNAQMRFVSGKDPYEGITFWDDWSNSFVMFAVTPAGDAGLFRHAPGIWSTLVDWQPVTAVHAGIGALNTLSVNLDPRSVALGRAFLINGVAMGKPCRDRWYAAIGSSPALPEHGLFVGLVVGSFSGAAHAAVTHASMYEGTNALPIPACPVLAPATATPSRGTPLAGTPVPTATR